MPFSTNPLEKLYNCTKKKFITVHTQLFPCFYNHKIFRQGDACLLEFRLPSFVRGCTTSVLTPLSLDRVVDDARSRQTFLPPSPSQYAGTTASEESPGFSYSSFTRISSKDHMLEWTICWSG